VTHACEHEHGVDLIVTSPRGGAEVIASKFEPTVAAAASL